MRKKQDGVKATHWYMYRPVYLLMVATILVNIQPMCMLIIGSWICDGDFTADQINAGSGNHYLPDGTFNTTADVAIPKGTAYSDGCSPSMRNFFFDNAANPSALVPNTVEGWMIQIFGTYLGFLLMFIGVCQATMLHHKIADKWRELRGTA